jgi:hypothetical protein
MGFLPKYTCGERVKYRAGGAMGQRPNLETGIGVRPTVVKEGAKKVGIKEGPGIRSGDPDSRGVVEGAKRGVGSAGVMGEACDQGNLALSLILSDLRHFLFAVGLHELASLGIAFPPDLREKIAVAVAIENEF